MPAHDVTAAKAQAAEKKSKLMGTVHELQERLKPATLALDAWHGVKDKSYDYADKGAGAVKEHPVTAAGIVAALLLVFGRGPIWSLVAKMMGWDDPDDRVTTRISTGDDKVDLTAPVIPAQEKEGATA